MDKFLKKVNVQTLVEAKIAKKTERMKDWAVKQESQTVTLSK